MKFLIKKKKEEEIFTEFGEKSIIEGELKSKNSILIKGKFSGTISSDREVIFFPNAFFNGKIKASSVSIQGKYEGFLEAQSITLKSGSSFNGEILTSKMKIEKGSILNGTIKTK